uniref:THAP-type domain-containing protein n=1 Tax=Cacopsylla melanoneura TaxID=428564 RepID=A0A8D8RBL0_9HEMI
MTAVCNFCAQTSPSNSLFKVHSTPLLKDKVFKHLPFIDLKIISSQSLHMCQKCKDALDKWSLFFNKCFQVQKTLHIMQKIKNCISVSKKNAKQYCCARYCQNTNLDEKLFCLPKNSIERAKQWLINADRTELLEGVDFNVDFIKRKTYTICRQHFESKMFFNDLRETLVATAVPTLFKTDLGIKKTKKKGEPELSNLRKIYSKPATEVQNIHSTNHNKENKISNLLMHSDEASEEVYSEVFLTEDSHQSEEPSVSNNELRYEISSNCTFTREPQLVTMGDSNRYVVDASMQVAPMDANTVPSQVVPSDSTVTCTGLELDSHVLPSDHPNTNQTNQMSAIRPSESSRFDFLDNLNTYDGVTINQQSSGDPTTNSSSIVCDILNSDPSKVILSAADLTSLSENSGFGTNENKSSTDKAMDTSEPCSYSSLCQEISVNTNSNLSQSFSSIQPGITFEKLNCMQSVNDVDSLMVSENLVLEEADCLIETPSEDLMEMPLNLVDSSSNMMEEYAYLIETPSDIVGNPANLMEMSGNVMELNSDLAETRLNHLETRLSPTESLSEPTLSDAKRSKALVDENISNYSVLDYDTSRLLNAQLSSGMMMYSCEFCGDTLLTEGLLQNHCKLYHTM